MIGSGTLSTLTSPLPCQTTAFTAPSPPLGEYLAYSETSACLRRERRRIEARAGSQSFQEVEQGLVSTVLRGPAELRTGPRSIHYGDVSREVQPPRRHWLQSQCPGESCAGADELGGYRHGSGLQDPSDLIGVEYGLSSQVERAASILVH